MSSRSVGLDAARAAAVVAVVACHWSQHLFGIYGSATAPEALREAGAYGVWAFFALSGILIGRILLDAEASWSGWRRFLTRRWMRTYPLYAVWLVGLLLAWPPAGDALATLGRFASFTQAMAGVPHGEWFGVSWSLAVEEWAYLLLSASILIAVRVFGRGAAMPTILAFVVLPALARVVLHLHGISPDRATLLELDGIAIGVAAAAWHRVGLRVPAWVGAALVCSTWFHLPLFRDMEMDIACAGFAILILSVEGVATLGRIGDAVAGGLSRYSYGIYLSHTPALAIACAMHGMAPGWACEAAFVLYTAVFSVAGYRWIEAPMMRLRPAVLAGRAPIPYVATAS